MGVRIPNELISGFETIISLPINDIKKISSFLYTLKTGTGINDFKNKLNSEFVFPNKSGLSDTLYSLGSILLNFDESIEEISEMLLEAIEKSVEYEYDSSDLKKKLSLLLKNAGNLKSTFKAHELLTENNINYRDSRIFSDIRLLFNNDIYSKKNIRDAIIIHRLKIETNRNGTDENFYVSLDSNDLIKFKELINRAITKDEQIKADYSYIKFIELTD